VRLVFGRERQHVTDTERLFDAIAADFPAGITTRTARTSLI
jgi:hypothetical protein